MEPRIAIAAPTREGGRPRPPVKWKGRDTGCSSEEEGEERGVERKMNQRDWKVPTVRLRRKRERRVVRTLEVHIRRRGRTLGVSAGGGGLRLEGVGRGCDSGSEWVVWGKEGVSGSADERAVYSWEEEREKRRRKKEARCWPSRMPMSGVWRRDSRVFCRKGGLVGG